MNEQHFTLIILFLALAIGVIAISKKFLRIPYTVTLVLVGLLVGIINTPVINSLRVLVSNGDSFGFIITVVFLPILLGEASLKISIAHVKKNIKPILLLAILGTFITYIFIGFTANIVLGLSISVAFVFASLMSATDPLSVLSIFKSMSVPKKLSFIIEGESLLNDGVAVVLFNISVFHLAEYIHMGSIGLLYGILNFAYTFIGAIIVGLVVGIIFSHIGKFFDDYPLETAFSVIMFYGVYLLAEYFHFSGVIAVVTSGLMLGNYGVKIGMTPTTHVNISTFWETAAFFANSLVFLMMGIEITTIDFNGYYYLILAIFIIVFLGRSISVYLSLSRFKGIPLSYKHIINWGGLKGSLSIALALGLPVAYQGRNIILLLTVSIVLATLLIQGLSVKFFLKALNIVKITKSHKRYEELLLQYYKAKASIHSLKESELSGFLTNHDYDYEVVKYRDNLVETFNELRELEKENPYLREERINKAKKNLLYAQFKAVENSSDLQIISEEVIDEEKKKVLNSIEKNFFV